MGNKQNNKDNRREKFWSNKLWYKDSIFYELFIRAFYDSNNDGIGDIEGLIQKLDYIQDLGVDCIWLLPFYDSPLLDDGYDIADYYKIHPDYGSIEDFKKLIEEAHKRELRIIADLVINHTSKDCKWFQEARSDPDSPYRDYYMWSDTPEKFKDARIIFVDSESSNWAYDDKAKQFYWHRFFTHQPDLNYDNPKVQEEMLNVVNYWLDMGLDGFRVDAVPYLFAREGTNCENLPETHQFLKKLRKHVDENYPGRLLLAEANQWPDDLLPYFGGGKGDEFHMAFNFPLMPRLFMSVRKEDHGPIVDIVKRTPDIPENCQWGIFLRNHDELTLEMCTDEERDYMYKTYAKEERMRCNIGIRRRLSTLLQNDKRQTQLLHSLLFSLPGTPIMYYGDEIRMGDNIFLGDRNGVRTPMQWSMDRNAGFSKAEPSRLYAPVLNDPTNNYMVYNVEAESKKPNSMLNWVRKMIKVRKQFEVFGRGGIKFYYPENHKVLVFIRYYKDEIILTVNNLSKYPQSVMVDLSEFEDYIPIEVFGKQNFPQIGELPYFFTIGSYDFYWFLLVKP